MWKPTASMANLRRRSKVLSQIRQFFAQRQVMEVETPCLSHFSVTDPHLSSFTTEFIGPELPSGQVLHLQTSPEYAMKRLLAAGSGCIYQFFKAFRNEEAGRFHNPEFSLLEWYRLGFDQFALMDEVESLVRTVLVCDDFERLSYRQAFQRYVGLDPFEASLKQLHQIMYDAELGNLIDAQQNKDSYLQLLFSHFVERQIGQSRPCFIYHFPASQAALAKIDPYDDQLACRFELYYAGIELANGFEELTDVVEQRQRFNQDNAYRQQLGKPQLSIDERFLAALTAGLPACSGVALGIDRLMMLVLSSQHIRQVMAFSLDNA